MEHIIAFLRSMDEPQMADEVVNAHNRLTAFSDGLDTHCLNVQITALRQQLEAAGRPAVAVFLAPPTPAGMQLVPVEPTEEMVLAAWGTPVFGKSSTDMTVTMAQAYRNMLAAAKEK